MLASAWRTTMTDTSGSTAWWYDARGRVIDEARTILGQPTFHTYTTYDALDRVVTTTYPDGEVVTTAYNAATQPVSLSGSSSYVSSAVYQATGALVQLTLGNGMVTTYTTNSASGRLVGLEVGDKLSLSYGYDANGNMVTRVLSGTPYTLVYDAENRLVQVKQGSTVLASYVYDGDGVLVKKVAGGQTTVYVGPHYEKNLTTGVVTKYYLLGGQWVAMRVGRDADLDSQGPWLSQTRAWGPPA